VSRELARLLYESGDVQQALEAVESSLHYDPEDLETRRLHSLIRSTKTEQ